MQMALSCSLACDSQWCCNAEEISSDGWVKSKIGVIRNGFNQTQIKPKYYDSDRKPTLLNEKQTNCVSIPYLFKLSCPLWYEILVSCWIASSPCTTIYHAPCMFRKQHLVSSIFVGCVSLVMWSAVLPSRDLLQRWLDIRLRHLIRCGEFSILRSSSWLVLVLGIT